MTKKSAILLISGLLLLFAFSVLASKLLARFDFSQISTVASPDGHWFAIEIDSKSEAGQAPYGQHIVLSKNAKADRPDDGYVIFAGYCEHPLNYFWKSAETIQIYCRTKEKSPVRTQVTRAFGIDVEVETIQSEIASASTAGKEETAPSSSTKPTVKDVNWAILGSENSARASFVVEAPSAEDAKAIYADVSFNGGSCSIREFKFIYPGEEDSEERLLSLTKDVTVTSLDCSGSFDKDGDLFVSFALERFGGMNSYDYLFKAKYEKTLFKDMYFDVTTATLGDQRVKLFSMRTQVPVELSEYP